MSEQAVEQAWGERLDAGARAMGIELSPEVRAKLLQFLALLVKWNRAYNLTAVRDPLQMVERHLLDSLSVLPYLKPGNILDVGTGPGLPGIPLALLKPDCRFLLLDSNGKKIRFVRQAILELGLDNVVASHARVESLQPEQPFDSLISRAFASLPKIIELTTHLRNEESLLLAMKGKLPDNELRDLDDGYEVDAIPLKVPFAEGERHLLVIKRRADRP
jgi:16S rRNA (guanine527-N7)-methyltransferase